jgi:hypothetical protein
MKKISVIAAAGLILASCGGNKPEETTKPITDTPATEAARPDVTTVNEITRFKFDFAVANIPAPAEIINDMASYNLPYNPAFLSDVSKASSYKTDFSKAINLGVYNLDMAYAMANNNGSDVMKYVKASLEEIDALGMRAAFDQMIGKRTETNINNKDSLLKIADEMYIKGDKYLRTNERIETATNIFVGSWIEALSIICRTGTEEKDAIQRARVHKQLWEQRFNLKNIIDLLVDFKSKEDVNLTKELTNIYREIDEVKEPKDMKGEKFESISKKILALRDKLIK